MRLAIQRIAEEDYLHLYNSSYRWSEKMRKLKGHDAIDYLEDMVDSCTCLWYRSEPFSLVPFVRESLK